MGKGFTQSNFWGSACRLDHAEPGLTGLVRGCHSSGSSPCSGKASMRVLWMARSSQVSGS
jgi:hypothetical protein